MNHEQSEFDSDVQIAGISTDVIDSDGIVQYSEVLDNAGKLPDLDAIKALLAGL